MTFCMHMYLIVVYQKHSQKSEFVQIWGHICYALSFKKKISALLLLGEVLVPALAAAGQFMILGLLFCVW